MSCRSILKKLLFQGAITQDEYDKLDRNLKTETDVVQVVHCKDCVNWDDDLVERTYNWCCTNDRFTTAEYFCADGERRAEEER